MNQLRLQNFHSLIAAAMHTSFKVSVRLVLASVLLGLLNYRHVECRVVHPKSCTNISFIMDAQNESLLNNALMNLSNHTVLDLQPGEHCIWNNTPIRNLAMVTIHGENNNTFIKCKPGKGLAFYDVENLTIEGVTILQCGLDSSAIETFKDLVRTTIDFFFGISNSSDNYIAVACAKCTNFQIKNSVITNTSGLGFLGINLVGDSWIENTSFTGNVPKGCFHLSVDDIQQNENTGGGALIIYHDAHDKLSDEYPDSSLHINNSFFYNNSYCGLQGVYEIYSHFSEEFSTKNFLLGGGGGLSILLTQIHYRVNVTVEKSTFVNNTAGYGGGANVEIFTAVFDSHVSFEDCNFNKNGIAGNLVLNLDYATAGSGLLFITDILQPTFNRSVDIIPEIEHVPCTLSISGTNFTENRGFSGGAILIISLYAPLLGGTLQEELHISSCRFVSNFGVLGAAIYAQEWKQSIVQRGLDIIFYNVTFDNNIVYSLSDLTTSTQTSAVIELITLNVTFSGDSVIANSTGTGLRTTSSVLIVMDDLTFYNNSGSFGGALRLETGALMVLRNNTNVTFSKNTGAVYGGAVYSSTVATLPSISQVDCPIYFGHLNLLCFSTTHSDCNDITEFNTNVIFEGNSAPLGSMVYGTTLETCPWALQLRNKYELQNSNLTLFELLADELLWNESSFSSPFVFDKPPNNITQVSTGTARIISNKSEIIAIPGETITIGIQTLDQFNRSVPTVLTSLASSDARNVHVSTLIGGSKYFLLQQSNDPDNLTVEANITFYGEKGVNSSSVSLFSLVSLSQSEITVNLTSCLDGFTYRNASHSCECSDLINAQTSRVECDHHDFTLHVSQDRWIGLGPNDELFIADCHFDYCLGGTRIIKPPDFDKQCQEGYNRSGIVCGNCTEGYSTVFGSNRCLKCSNKYVSMIIVFALLGIALVSAISFLQITISEGYLNGMLFYANVLNLYLPLLTKSGSNIVHIFFLVSLLNLNLGFESCFYDGMNALARTGLNLVFPFYIFSLMFIIILLVKWSNRFSIWFTRNGFSAAKVFVTLLVMSYSSLLETCIEILGVDTIRAGNHTHIRWRIDDNQAYFHGGHAALGFVAIILIIFLLPIPFLLLFEGRIFKFRIFHRYKPLYDAVWAPFKPKFRFWVGLRLILRGLPFIFVNTMPHPLNILFLATFLVALLWIQGMLQPFRGFARNAFDTFFIADLLIVILLALYFYIYLAQFEITDNSKQDALFHRYQVGFYSVVVGVAYIGFLLIILWHLALRFPRLMKFLNSLKRFKNTASIISERKLVAFAHSEQKPTRSEYGSLNSEGVTSSDSSDEGTPQNYDSDNVVHERKNVITYSQWREPLLESGSLEIETRDGSDA